jgi:RNA polymerase sigma-70 factor (ECF subfamily)
MDLCLGTIMTNQDNSTSEAVRVSLATDEQLVVLALKDDRYYEIIVERYESKLRRYVLRFIRCSEEDAQDIIQDVFINAYRNLNGFDADLKFSSWLYRIAHNEAVSHLRRISARPTVIMEGEKFEALASELNTEVEVGNKIEGIKLRAAIGRLDEKYRDVIVLRYLEEKSYEEVSDILQKPSGSVSSLIARAKRILLKELEKENITS